MLINKNLIELLKLMKNQRVSRKSQKIYKSSLGYFLAMRYLRERGLVKEDGIEDREKYWTLSEKGKKLLKHVEEIEKLIRVE